MWNISSWRTEIGWPALAALWTSEIKIFPLFWSRSEAQVSKLEMLHFYELCDGLVSTISSWPDQSRQIYSLQSNSYRRTADSHPLKEPKKYYKNMLCHNVNVRNIYMPPSASNTGLSCLPLRKAIFLARFSSRLILPPASLREIPLDKIGSSHKGSKVE